MAHKRQLLREALMTMLTGTTTAGTNVYANRVTTDQQSELPMIKIFYGSESSKFRATGSQQRIRTLNLIVEILAEANEDLDDQLDSLSKEVEDIIAANYSLSGTATGTQLTSTEPSFEDGAEKQVGKLTLNFETIYLD